MFGRASLAGTFSGGAGTWTTACELHYGNAVIGSAADILEAGSETFVPNVTLNTMGTATVPAGGAEISLWCLNGGSAFGTTTASGADILLIKVGGTF